MLELIYLLYLEEDRCDGEQHKACDEEDVDVEIAQKHPVSSCFRSTESND